MKKHRSISRGTDQFSSKSVLLIDILWIFHVKVFVGRSKYFYCIICKNGGEPRSFLLHKTFSSYLFPYLPRESLPFLSFMCQEYENISYTHSALSQNLEAATGN